MPHSFEDRTKETSTTTGTGDVTLAGAVAGFMAFSAGFAVGDANIPYCIQQQVAGDWEIGLGTYVSANVLRRDTVLSNSAGTVSLINFAAGTKDVFVTLPGKVFADLGRVLASARGYAIP